MTTADFTVEQIWNRLSDGFSDEWLQDVRSLPTADDDFEATLDIWSVALTAALKEPGHGQVASKMLARLREISEEIEAAG